ncbi:hypothetical protein [Umezawaea sp.]|uniref:hypothetical protein n=1 Tax=Umezawaea sp. TaxID=1955258 RepID=UPI002ED50A8C
MANRRRIGGAGGGSDKAGSGLAPVGVAVVALGVFGAGATGTSTGVLTSAGGGGAAGGGASAGESLVVRKAESGKAARKGDSGAAWRRMGLREGKRAVRQDAECLVASHGEVREFFLHTPCTSLDRVLFTVLDGVGNSAVVSVAWVGFRTRREVSDFKSVIDRPGSGDIRPLAGSLLDVADIRFTGLNYGSDVKGKEITIAEAETATGAVAPDVLDAVAEVAALLPRP